MSGVRQLHVLMLAACLAGVCHAQPGAQIAATKSRAAAGSATVGGPTPTRSSVKPRFPILPAGAVIQPVNLKAKPRAAAANTALQSPVNSAASAAGNVAPAVSPTSNAAAPASTNAPTGAKAAENKATSGPSGSAKQGPGKGSRSKAQPAPSVVATPANAAAQGGTQSH